MPMHITPNTDTKVPYIPDEAIRTSEEARKPKTSKIENIPKPDKYSEEKISPTQPSNAEVKKGFPDPNVKGG